MYNHKKVLLILLLFVMLTFAMLPLNIVKAENQPLFEVTIIVPGNANMLRRQWGQIIANSLIQLGIDARVVYLDWTSVFDRCLLPAPELVGKTWDEGGFDLQLVGYTPSLVPQPAQYYYGSEETFAPTGRNYYLFNSTEANGLMDTFLTTTNVNERDQVSQRLQTVFYNEVPASIIMFSATPAVVTPELGGPALSTSPNGEGFLYFNVQPDPELLTGRTEVVYASTGEIESLIPPLSFSWYDSIIYRTIYDNLVRIAPDLSNFSVPDLLTSWTSSNNGFKWTLTCRENVKWHDGEDFTADDVVFSIWANLNGGTGTAHQGDYIPAFGDNVTFTYSDASSTTWGIGTRVGNVTAVNATTVEIWLPDARGMSGKPYGYLDPYLLGFDQNIIPKHIFENIAPVNWTDSVFNTGVGSIDIGGTTYTGPVGTGPYKWVDYDSVGQIIHLEKNLNYWNRTALEAAGLFGVTDYYIKYIIDKTSALAALKNDEVDMLDPQYQMQADVSTIGSSWGKVLLNEGTGVQEVGYQHRHPIFGTGVDTPLGQSTPSRAAEAARYVRTAFDYAIPRQLIIDNLLAGFGQPAAVHWLPASPFYNASVTARPYDLSKAKEYLELAGYTIPGPPTPPALPSFLLGMSTTLSDTFTDEDGNLLANRELSLWVTTDNATYETTSTMIGRTTTDLSGWYSFTVTPSSTGASYYYLFDRLATVGSEWQYVTMLNVSSLDDALAHALEAKLDAINATLVSINGTVGTLKTDLGTLEVRLDAINATLVSINGRTAAIETDIGVIETDMNTINAKLAALNSTMATIQTDIGTITVDIANIQLKVIAINGTIATIQTTLGTIEGQITSIEENIVTIETDIGIIWTILEGWTSGTSSPISTPLGDFQVFVLTTSTLEDPVAFSDNVVTINLSGLSGTTGTTNIVIPKQLLVGIESSIDKVAVTIDDEQLVFTYTEQPEAYVLQITYTHSMHLMKVYLTGFPPTPFQAWIIAIIVLIVAAATGIAFYILKLRKPRNTSETKIATT